MAPIFFAFSFFAKNEEKRAIFCEKWKKTKKIIPMKIGQNCIQLNKCYKCFNHLTGKNFYTRIFFIFLSLFMLETMWSFRNLSKMSNIEPKIGKKWRKSIFHFLSSHFLRKTKNWKKCENANFFVSVGPIGPTQPPNVFTWFILKRSIKLKLKNVQTL